MAGPILEKYTLVPRGGPGLACDLERLTLGPLVLAQKVRDAAGDTRYELLPLEDIVRALHLAYGPIPESVLQRCCRGLARVTRLLAAGENALASIDAVLIGFPEIAADRMAKLDLAAASLLGKYNPNWEDQPRIPAGNSDAGEWTDESDSRNSCNADFDVTDIAYPGMYHDQVVAELASHWMSQGQKLLLRSL